jgi:hypothetical protein
VRDEKKDRAMTTLPLNPTDWEDLRQNLHNLLDRCVDQMRDAEDHPWQALPMIWPSAMRLGRAGTSSHG